MPEPVYTASRLPEGAQVWGTWGGKSGPTHVTTRGAWSQAWCGARPQFRHTMKPEGTPVTCPTCLRRLALGQAQARGARR